MTSVILSEKIAALAEGSTATTTTAAKHLLQRFCIDNLALLYKVDHLALKISVSSTALAADDDDEDDLKAPVHAKSTRPSILTEDERDEILCLAKLLRDTWIRVRRRQINLITENDINEIYSRVLLPAKELGLSGGFAINLVRLYAFHKGIYRRKAGHYGRIPIRPIYTWFMLSQECLGRLINCDKGLVQKVAPNYQTQVLLETAVTKFEDKNWTDRRLDQKKCWRCRLAGSLDNEMERVISNRVTLTKSEK